MHPRMERERQTVARMIAIFCRERHATREEDLCDDCRELLDYAMLRLARCPFQEGKTTCGNCPVHCYKAEKREMIREVMRYSGPRMLRRHPLLALAHMLDGLRKEPVRKAKARQP